MNQCDRWVGGKRVGVPPATADGPRDPQGAAAERLLWGAGALSAVLCCLALPPQSAWAGPGIFINDGTDDGCLWTYEAPGTSPIGYFSGIADPAAAQAAGPNAATTFALPTNSQLGGVAQNLCGSGDRHTQTTRALFYRSGSGLGANALSLGGDLFVNSGNLGLANTLGNSSMRIGSLSTLSVTNSGARSIAIGNGGLRATSATGEDAIAIGSDTTASGLGAVALGLRTTAAGEQSTIIGPNAGGGSQAGNTFQVAIGASAGLNVNGTGNAAVGPSSGGTVVGNSNSAYGVNAGRNVTGSANTAVGANSGQTTAGTNNLALGTTVGTNVSGDANTAIGQNSGRFVNGFNNIAIGSSSGSGSSAAVFRANRTTAIGNGATAYGNDAIALGSGATAGVAGQNNTNINGIAIGNGARAVGNQSISIGTGNVVNGARSGAIGDPSIINGSDSYSVGNNNTLATNNTFALGNNIATTIGNDVLLGNGSASYASGAATAGTAAYASSTQGGITYSYAGGAAPGTVVSVGNASSQGRVQNVAAGAVSASSTDAINGSQLFAAQSAIGNLAASAADHLGGGAAVNADGSLSAPSYSVAGGAYNNVGDALDAQDTVVTALGNSVAGGLGGTSSYDAATGTLTTGLQVGGTTYNNVNDALNDLETAATAGWNLSAQGAGQSNVAAGSATGANVDLNNGDGNIVVSKSTTSNDVRFDLADDIAIDSVTLGSTVLDASGLVVANGPSLTTAGIDAGGLPITNVAAGVDPTDAVNVSQLNSTIAANSTGYYAVNSSGGGNAANDGATGADAIALGKDVQAAGDRSVALGLGAQAAQANSVALGAGATTSAAVAVAGITLQGNTYSYAGSAPVGVLSVGSAGQERQIQHVAAGQVSATSTDAVNGSQLHATHQAVQLVGDRVMAIEGDITAIAGNLTSIQGDITDVGNRVTVLEGALGSAVNYDSRIASLEAGTSGAFQVNPAGGSGAPPQATGANAAAGGHNAVASGSNSTALGNDALASGSSSTAIGQGARATHDNSVALGQGSATTVGAQAGYAAAYVGASQSTGEVNIGGRTLTGLAPGAAGTDAVNVNQLRAGVDHAVAQSGSYTDQRVGELRNALWTIDRGYRGATASAMAMAALPQAYLPGKSMLSMAVGGYQSESGIAIGLSGITDNGRYVYKVQASGNTARHWGVSVGAGVQW